MRELKELILSFELHAPIILLREQRSEDYCNLWQLDPSTPRNPRSRVASEHLNNVIEVSSGLAHTL